MSTTANQRSARTTNELIKQLPTEAAPYADMLRRLGLWTTRSHASIDERRPFLRNLAEAGPDQLADEHAYWTSEAGRITELHGFLVAQKVKSDLELKLAAAKARTTIRRQNQNRTGPDGKPVKMTAAEVNDQAEGQQVLIDAREASAIIETTLASLAATKEATLLYLNTLSREITRRGDLLKARVM